MKEYFLPIRIIPKDCNVILYGAGKMGHLYYKQNEELHWCNIVAVADKNSESVGEFPVKVISPGEIRQCQYDYVVITQKSIAGNKEHSLIIDELVTAGVDRNRILEDATCCLWSGKSGIVFGDNRNSRRQLSIAYVIRNRTLGDHVISLKLYQAIISLIDNGCIDILSYNSDIAKTVYYNQQYLGSINQIREAQIDNRMIEKYDFALEFGFEPKLLCCNLHRLSMLAPDLAAVAERMLDYQKWNGVDLPEGVYENGIHMNRAKFLGKNRFSLLGCVEGLDISDQKVKLYIDGRFQSRFDALKLRPPYITFACGAGGSPDGKLQQTKSWPKKNYEELIHMVKAEYGNISIVQIGKDNRFAVNGADRYVFNEEIGTVEYILKNSLLHVDCESGLVHLATQLGTKCVVMFGPTPIWFFGYEDNINIPPKECGGCKDLVPDWFFRCFRYESPKCMESIKAEEVFAEIKACLG